MKNLVLMVLLGAFISTQAQKTTVCGKIENAVSKEILIFYDDANGMQVDLAVSDIADDGTFKAVFDLDEKRFLNFLTSNEQQNFYAVPGDSIYFTLNTVLFDETVVYSGDRELENNYLIKKYLMLELLYGEMMQMGAKFMNYSVEEFIKFNESCKTIMNLTFATTFKENTGTFDQDFYDNEQKRLPFDIAYNAYWYINLQAMYKGIQLHDQNYIHSLTDDLDFNDEVCFNLQGYDLLLNAYCSNLCYVEDTLNWTTDTLLLYKVLKKDKKLSQDVKNKYVTSSLMRLIDFQTFVGFTAEEFQTYFAFCTDTALSNPVRRELDKQKEYFRIVHSEDQNTELSDKLMDFTYKYCRNLHRRVFEYTYEYYFSFQFAEDMLKLIKDSITNPVVREGILLSYSKEYLRTYDTKDEHKKIIKLHSSYSKSKENKNELKEFYENLISLSVGQEAPVFSYPDIDGNMVSLSDLRGKYVYIDVWATWCGPCVAEIPNYRALQKEYEGKNIIFLSIG